MKNKIILSLLAASFLYGAENGQDAPETPGIQMKKLEEVDKTVAPQKDKKAVIEDLEVDEKAKGVGENRIKGPSFILQNVSVTGNTILDQKEIVTIVKPFVGKSVDSIDLKSISQKITKLYTEKGYVTSKCIIPVQKVQNGTVKFQIIEDKLARIILKGKDSYNYSANMFMKYLAELQGKVINAEKVNEKLVLLTNLPVTKIKPSLQKGAQGYTNLILEITDAKEKFSISTDNSGSKYTGQERLTFNGSINNIRGKSDSLALSVTTVKDTENLTSFALNYLHPVGTEGARVNFQYSQMNYMMEVDSNAEVRSKFSGDVDNVTVNYQGNSKIYGLTFSKPLNINQQTNASYQIGFENRTTTTDDVVVNVYATNGTKAPFRMDDLFTGSGLKAEDKHFIINGAFNISRLDDLFSNRYRGINSAALKIKKGMEGLFDTSKAQDITVYEKKNIKSNSDMDFLKLYYNFSRQQLLPLNITMNLKLSGDYTNNRVPDSFEYGGGDYGYGYSASFSRNFNYFNASISASRSKVYTYDTNMHKSSKLNGASGSISLNTSYEGLYMSLSYSSSFDSWDSNTNNLRYNIKYSW